MTDKSPRKKTLPIPGATAVPIADAHIVASIKALHAGTATAHQQQSALQWIIRDAAGKAVFPYHPSERDTAFALGRLFVADLILGLFNADLSSLRRE